MDSSSRCRRIASAVHPTWVRDCGRRHGLEPREGRIRASVTRTTDQWDDEIPRLADWRALWFHISQRVNGPDKGAVVLWGAIRRKSLADAGTGSVRWAVFSTVFSSPWALVSLSTGGRGLFRAARSVAPTFATLACHWDCTMAENPPSTATEPDLPAGPATDRGILKGERFSDSSLRSGETIDSGPLHQASRNNKLPGAGCLGG